jgi:hypothetical protein
MLDDPLFASAVSPAALRTLKDPAFQKRAAGEPATETVTHKQG